MIPFKGSIRAALRQFRVQGLGLGALSSLGLHDGFVCVCVFFFLTGFHKA